MSGVTSKRTAFPTIHCTIKGLRQSVANRVHAPSQGFSPNEQGVGGGKMRKTKSAVCTHKTLMPNLYESSKNTQRLDVEFNPTPAIKNSYRTYLGKQSTQNPDKKQKKSWVPIRISIQSDLTTNHFTGSEMWLNSSSRSLLLPVAKASCTRSVVK